MTDFLNSIEDTDFAVFLQPTDLEKAKYIEMIDGAYYQNAGCGFDPSVNPEDTEYLYKDGAFRKVEKFEKDFPNSIGFFLNVYKDDEKNGYELRNVLLYPIAC